MHAGKAFNKANLNNNFMLKHKIINVFKKKNNNTDNAEVPKGSSGNYKPLF